MNINEILYIPFFIYYNNNNNIFFKIIYVYWLYIKLLKIQ